MNIILFEQNEITTHGSQQIVITDHRAKHIVKVIRSEVGDRLGIGVINGAKGSGVVAAITRKYPFSVTLDLQFDKTKTEDTPQIDLILALPRPIMLRRILSQTTTLGIGTFHIIQANRVEKSFWEASLLDPEEYRQHLVTGLEQAVATRLPTVQFHKKFKPFVEDFLPNVTPNYSSKILADPRGEIGVAEALIRDKKVATAGNNRTLLCIGPEGGWVDYELDKFRETGCSICTIGPRILKVDTAVIALHSRITALQETI